MQNNLNQRCSFFAMSADNIINPQVASKPKGSVKTKRLNKSDPRLLSDSSIYGEFNPIEPDEHSPHFFMDNNCTYSLATHQCNTHVLYYLRSEYDKNITTVLFFSTENTISNE